MTPLISFFKYILSNDLVRSSRNLVGKKLLGFPGIKESFKKTIDQETIHLDEKNKKLYTQYQSHFTIPEEGLLYDKCLELIKTYSEQTLKMVRDKQFSGTIYQSTLNEPYQELDLPKTLESLYLEIHRRSHMWNGLHDEEFHLSNLINLQLVSCVGELFGGDIGGIHGLVTTGGTQSMMTAARAYLNWGMDVKNLSRENCVIVAPDTIHASLIKAKEAYGFNLVLVPTNDCGIIDKNMLQQILEKHSDYLVALYCSLPSFPYGTKDDIYFFAEMANKYMVGLHVDCCLGGFIVNFVDDHAKSLLKIDGITSISVDTHKNGLAPKGTSILLTKKLGENNLLYHSIYAFSDWKGGLYGTMKDEGSSSCVEAFCALITLLYYGKKYYRSVANRIHTTTKNITDYLNQNTFVRIINPDCVNVVAIKLNLKNGATYHLADLMKERGYVFNTLTNDIIHFCITKRFVSNEETVEKFLLALDECIEIVAEEISSDPNIHYDGSARLYCSVNTINQMSEDKSFRKYIENYFFGEYGIKESIKKHFLSINNPFYH